MANRGLAPGSAYDHSRRWSHSSRTGQLDRIHPSYTERHEQLSLLLLRIHHTVIRHLLSMPVRIHNGITLRKVSISLPLHEMHQNLLRKYHCGCGSNNVHIPLHMVGQIVLRGINSANTDEQLRWYQSCNSLFILHETRINQNNPFSQSRASPKGAKRRKSTASPLYILRLSGRSAVLYAPVLNWELLKAAYGC